MKSIIWNGTRWVKITSGSQPWSTSWRKSGPSWKPEALLTTTTISTSKTPTTSKKSPMMMMTNADKEKAERTVWNDKLVDFWTTADVQPDLQDSPGPAVKRAREGRTQFQVKKLSKIGRFCREKFGSLFVKRDSLSKFFVFHFLFRD